jgi:cytochrome oxidase Cu insertion factor (SCO1/SenC/PrrC family)
MSTSANALRLRNLRTLALLAALFFLPLAIAFWTYYGTGWRPSAHVNHGELINPPVALPLVSLQPAMSGEPVPASQLRRKWSLVYVGNGDCNRDCRHALYVMRQVRLALNNQMSRIERIFLVTGGCCDRQFLRTEHAGLAVLDATSETGVRLLSGFPGGPWDQSLFVVDPLGNLMMRYDVRRDPKGLLEDLKKLLSLSHIG